MTVASLVENVARITQIEPRRIHKEHAELVIAEQLRKAGVDPALIHAFEQTGHLISTENEDQFSQADVERFDRAIDNHRAGTTRLTTDELLACEAAAFADQVAELNAHQCELHAKVVLKRLQGADYESYLKALIRVAMGGPDGTSPEIEQYLVMTNDLFPDVPADDDVLGRLAGLMLRAMSQRLARHTTLRGPLRS